MKKIKNRAWMALALILIASSFSLSADDKQKSLMLDHIRQIKPLSIAPSLSIPSADAVKEVGGIQYGRHVDIKLNDGTNCKMFSCGNK
jgi:hypothetical protein